RHGPWRQPGCPTGSRGTGPRPGRSSFLVLGRERGDERMVLVDLTQTGGTAGGTEIVEEVHVGVVVLLPLLGGVVLVEDRLDRADRLARTAVDALVGVDVQHPLALVDAVDRTFVDAGAVLDVHTRLGDHVGHWLDTPHDGLV